MREVVGSNPTVSTRAVALVVARKMEHSLVLHFFTRYAQLVTVLL